MEDHEAVVAATAITETRVEGPSSVFPLPFINSLREVSSQLQAFQASPETPDGTACGSALNAARQISYWSSVFISMMEASNPGQPTCTTSLSTSMITALSTSASSTSTSSTSAPFTSASSTSAPFTSASSTSVPFTSASSTSVPCTSASSTSAPFTSASSTSAPFTSASTSAPFTSASSTSASSTLVSSTSTSPTSSSVVNHLPSTLDTMPICQHSLTSPPVFFCFWLYSISIFSCSAIFINSTPSFHIIWTTCNIAPSSSLNLILANGSHAIISPASFTIFKPVASDI